jgi:hypothetical protein
MAVFFGFDSGYIFTFLHKHKINFNKTNTRDLILDACGIDIFNDPDYNFSQEQCIRKIWGDKDDYTNGCLLKVMLDFYLGISNWDWGWKEQQDYEYLCELQKSLCETKSLPLPSTNDNSLIMLQRDIEKSFNDNTPELVLDRLHTYSTHFFREICQKHSIQIKNDKDEYLPLDTIVANLKNFYKSKNYFSSEFCVIAIQSSINCFSKFNDIRNKQSFAHANAILGKIEAEYVVQSISNTLNFINKAEEIIDKQNSDDLPF